MTVREKVFQRDGNRCRVCQIVGTTSLALFGILEWAHLKARGMGGNPTKSRDTTENTICCCAEHHRGRRSLHSGHLKWRHLTDKGADGAMEFCFQERLPKAELGLSGPTPEA